MTFVRMCSYLYNLMYNLTFYSKNYNRYIQILKYSKNKFHFMHILQMEKIIIFFNIKELTEMNQTTVLSCLFFFKYYFGVIPFFSNYSYFFKLNISYFNFLIEYNFIKSLMFYSFFYFLNDVIYMINKIHVSYKITKNY